MTLRHKILLRIYALTFLLILAMSGIYYYVFTRDVRERSQQQVAQTFDLILDDLSTKTRTISPKIDQFVLASLTKPLYTLQILQSDLDLSQQESVLWYVKKVTTYLHAMAIRMREFGTLVEASEIRVYGKDRGLLVVGRQEGEDKTMGIYLAEVNGMFFLVDPDDRWYATLQDLKDLPRHPLPTDLSPVYQGTIPDTQTMSLSSFKEFVTFQFTVPIVEREEVQGVCVIRVPIRQKDVERYARLSGTRVNVFVGSALSVGTLPEYRFIPGEFTKVRQNLDLLSISELPPTEFSDMKIQGQSYYQGTLVIGDKDTLVGAISVHFPRWLEEKQKRNFFMMVAGIALFFSVLAVGEALGLSAMIARPISRLMMAMKDVENGKFDVTAPVDSKDEIGKLAETFNTMTAQIKKYREHLEELVEERTTKLQKEITERKRAEEEVLLLKNAIETAKVGVTITDTNRKILYVNLAEAIMHGYTVAELIGNDVRIFSPKEYWQDIDFEQLEKHWTRESVNIRKDGTTFPIHSISTPVWNEVGNPVGIITVSEDITERKRAEEELQKAKEAADAANRAKSEFLANMSHDIRTPMNAILGFSEILKEQLRDTPQYQEYLNRITSSGHNLLRLINDILDLSRIEAGRLEIQLEPVNLHVVLNEIYNMFSLKAKEKGLRFKTYISLNTPPTVLLDGARLRQILVNLVGNAIKFTEKGSVTLKVELQIANSELRNGKSEIRNLKFEIEDTGIGIPQEDQHQIFDPFRQHTRSFGGTGLGLSITKRLVELMNGTISVESTVNKGSVFSVLFPEISFITTEEEGTAEKDSEIRDIQFDEATVLLAEDVESNRALVRNYLVPYNFHIVEAENGQEVIQTLKQLRPDIILMDIHMPVMGGYQATQIIKADHELRKIPVVALTAYAMKDQREQFQAIYDAYLSKPISKSDLIATLAEFLPHTKSSLEGGQGSVKSPLKEPVLSSVEEGQGSIDADRMPVLPKSEILEELTDYATQTGPFPQAFLDKLRLELLPKHKEVNELMSVDDIMDFSETVIGAGDTFTIPPLKHYGEELLHSIKVFNIFKVKHLLALFPDIVEIITGNKRECQC